MEEMNRRNDQGLGLLCKYIMMFLFCTDLFYRKRKKEKRNILNYNHFKVQSLPDGPIRRGFPHFRMHP